MRKFVLSILAAAFLCSCLPPEDIGFTWSSFWYGGVRLNGADAPSKLNIASVCLQQDADPETNRKKILRFIDTITADHPETDLIVFGETSLGYYYRPGNAKPYQESIAETVPGPTSTAVSREADAHDVYVSFGLAENGGGVLYNSQVLIGPDGKILAKHRKVHLTAWDMKNGFQPGSGVTFTTVKGVPTAMIVCYDSMDSRIARELIAGKPRLTLLSLADLTDENFMRYDLSSFAFGTYTVTANRVGTEDGNTYDGHHVIADPTGGIIVKSSGKEGYIFAQAGIR